MYMVRKERMGIPQDSRDAFDLLITAGRLDSDLAGNLKNMVGFRNIAVHNYQKLNLDIVQNIIEDRLGDFLSLAKWTIHEA